MSSESQAACSTGDPPWDGSPPWSPFDSSFTTTLPNTVTPIPGQIVIGPSSAPVYGPYPIGGGGGISLEDPEAAEFRLAIKAIKSIVRSDNTISAEDKLRAIDALLLAILPEK